MKIFIVTNFILCNNDYLKLPIGILVNTFKKQYGNSYSFLVSVIVSSFVSIVHSRLSPFFKSSISLTNAGTVVVNEPATVCTLVCFFNCMPPIYDFLYINKLIYVNRIIYNYLYRNLYILNKSNL